MKRIVDERPDSAEAVFLRTASGRHVPSRSRQRAVLSLALASRALTTTTSAAATGTATVAWIKGSLAVLALGVSSGLALREPEMHVATIAAPPHVTKSPAQTAPREEPFERPRPEPASLPVSAPSAPQPAPRPPRTPDLPVRATAEIPPPPRASSLLAEIAQLEAAKGAAQAGHDDEALRLLDAHDTTYPRGKLQQEADALRIRSLSNAGRQREASQRLRAFRATYPSSPHTAGLEALVEGAPRAD